MACKSIVDSLKKCMDKQLSVRDDLGLILKTVSIVTRTWSGERIGDGTATDVEVKLTKPTPRIVDLYDDINIAPGGRVEDGDLLVTGISKNKYPNKSDIDCSTPLNNKVVEKLYKIGSEYYEVLRVREKYLTWQVEVRKLRAQGVF